jgi:hypothetical protein
MLIIFEAPKTWKVQGLRDRLCPSGSYLADLNGTLLIALRHTINYVKIRDEGSGRTVIY